MSSSNSKDISLFIRQPLPPILTDCHELLGVLDSIEPAGDGLLRIRVAGVERCVPEELEGQLRPLVGKKVSILRADDKWTIVEVPAS